MPEIIGVITRRRSDRRAVRATWNIVATMTSEDIIAGPPSTSAVMHTTMNTEDGPLLSVYPAPILHSLKACRIITKPETTIPMRIAQDRYSSDWPAARTMTVPYTTIVTNNPMIVWKPRKMLEKNGGFSSGSYSISCPTCRAIRTIPLPRIHESCTIV